MRDIRKLPCVVLFVLLAASVPLVYASEESEKSGTGTVVVGNLAPTILSMGIYETGVLVNLTAIDPWTQYEFTVSASDANQLVDIINVTVTLRATTGVEGVFNKSNSYGFQYDNSTGTPTWKELTASGWVTSYTYLNDSASSWPTGITEGTWKFVAKLYKTAHRETTWTMKGSVKDKGSLSDTKSNTDITVNRYISFTIPLYVSWWGNPGDTNITAVAMPANVDVTANDVVTIQVKGSGNLTRSGDTETIPLSNVYVGQTNDPANNDGVKLTTSYQNLYTSLTSTDNTPYPTYWFLTIPGGTSTGTYTFTYYIQVV